VVNRYRKAAKTQLLTEYPEIEVMAARDVERKAKALANVEN